MEVSRRGNRDDHPRLPALSLGLSSVRLIVNKIEAAHARAAATDSRELVKYDPNSDQDDDYDSPLDQTTGQVWYRFAVNLGQAFSTCIPSVSFVNLGVVAITAGLFAPRMFSYLLVYPFCRLVFGTLYPAYASYKAVRTKNLKEYVKWMMYWIVFALFTCTETFTDVFLSWFPFYYEVKIVLVLWLLSPATKGSSFLYRKFVHPALCRREQEIDEYIAKAKDQGYHTVLNLGTKGVNYATTVIMQTAIKGGGGIVQQIRKSYSLSDLSECDPQNERSADEADDVLTEPKVIRRQVKGGYMTRRSASESNSRSMYFPEVDVDIRSNRSSGCDEPDFSHIKSSEDISSGYSSADNSVSLHRTASVGARVRAKSTRTAVTAIKRPPAAEGDDVIIEELLDDDSFEYSNMPALVNVPPHIYLSNTDPPFLYQYVGDQIRIIQVLGDNPLLNKSNNSTKNTDQWDQNEATFEDASPTLGTVNSEHKINTTNIEHNNENTGACIEQFNKHEADKNTPSKEACIEEFNKHEDEERTPSKEPYTEHFQNEQEQSQDTKVCLEEKCDMPNVTENEKEITSNIKSEDINEVKITESKTDESAQITEKYEEVFRKVVTDTSDPVDTTSLETSMNENDSADSDDEASFGTPDESPRSKRKSPKGKYGKGKAPPPPSTAKTDDPAEATSELAIEAQENPSENLIDSLKYISNTNFKESGHKGLQVVSHIAEKKRRHKSKSPARIPKGSSSGLGKLFQLPGKLAFWNKSDDPRKSKDNMSSSSEDQSRRSSAIEKIDQEFQSCETSVVHISINDNQDPLTRKEIDSNNNNQSPVIKADDVKSIADDQISFQDATDFETEVISHELMEKSDALQRLIEAKLESHPEYKIVPLHGEIPTSSKSTDV